MAGPIRKIIELFVDAAAARRAERAMQDSLNRGTNSRRAVQQLGLVERSMGRLAAAARLFFVGGGLGLFLRKLVTESSAAQAAQAQLGAAIESTGGAAGRSLEQLNQHAAALQQVTTFSDEAIGSAQALLLTFTRIRGETFAGATEAVLDLATAMGGDLKSASIQIGKALNDPVRGITALQRVGVSFTESQKETIKALAETGRMAEAQALILRELQVEFGGSAAAARDTLGGALQGLSNAWGEAFEVSQSASAGIVGAINDLALAIGPVRERIDSFFRRIQELGINAAVNVERLRVGFRTLIRDWAIAAGASEETIAMLTEKVEQAEIGLVRMEEAAVESIAELYKPPERKSLPALIAEDADEATEALEKLRDEAEKLSRTSFFREDLAAQAAESDAARIREQERQAFIQGLPGTTTTRTTEPVAPPVVGALEETGDVMDGLKSVADELFGTMEDGTEDVGLAWLALAELMQGSVGGALKRIADMKATEMLAHVIEEAARGIAALATGNVPAAKGHAVAAAKFGAAAAAWKVVGGVAGGGGGGGGGNQGGAGGFGIDSGRVARAADGVQAAAPNITIIVDGIDPDNPRHIELGQRLFKNAQEQWGNQKPLVRRYGRTG